MASTEKSKTIVARVRALVSVEENRVVTEKMLSAWIDNYRFASDALGRSIRNLLLLVLLFTMLATANLSDTTIFGLTFERPDVPMLLSYSIAGFMLYRVVALFMFSQLVEEAIRECYYQLHTDWQVNGLTDLADYPSMTQIELALQNMEESTTAFSVVSQVFIYPALMVACLGGLAWLVWGGHALITLAPGVLSIASVVVVGLLALRSIVLVIQGSVRAGAM